MALWVDLPKAQDGSLIMMLNHGCFGGSIGSPDQDSGQGLLVCQGLNAFFSFSPTCMHQKHACLVLNLLASLSLLVAFFSSPPARMHQKRERLVLILLVLDLVPRSHPHQRACIRNVNASFSFSLFLISCLVLILTNVHASEM
eukprot:1159025-Pelagomonas_calceolata.AAC.7